MVIQAVRYLVTTPCLVRQRSDTLTVKRLRNAAVEWLSPPDPSMNYNSAREMRHKGTTTWFVESSTYKYWKKSGSLFWIHGKRMFIHSLGPLCNK